MFSKHLKSILAAVLVLMLLQSCEKNSTNTPETGTAPLITIAQDTNLVLYHIGDKGSVKFEIKTTDSDNDLTAQQIWFNDSSFGQTSYSYLEFVATRSMFQNGKQQLKIVATDAKGNSTTAINNYVSSDLLIWKQDYHRSYSAQNAKVFGFSDKSSFMYDGVDSILACSADGSVTTGYSVNCYGNYMDKLSGDRIVTLGGQLTVYDKQFNIIQSHDIDLSGIWPMGFMSLNNDNVLLYSSYESDLLLRCYSLEGTILWQKIYGHNLVESGFTIDQSADGSIFVSCQSNSSGHGGSDILVYKLTGQGEIIWQQFLGSNRNEYNYSIHADLDGGCLIGANTSASSAGWLIKLDQAGNKLWDNFSLRGSLIKIDQYSNGNYLILSRYVLNGEGGSTLTLVSPSGSVLNKITLNRDQFDDGIKDYMILPDNQLLLFYAPDYTYYDNFMKLDFIK